MREAIVLPCLFLTVTLLGGLRIGTPSASSHRVSSR